MVHTDTDPRVRELITAGFRRLTPEARPRMTMRMSQDCRELARVGARLRHPEFTPEQVEAAVAEIYVGAALLAAARRKSAAR